MDEQPERERADTVPTVARVTVNLVRRANDALDATAALTGDDPTTVINRAIQVYALLEEYRSRGMELSLVCSHGHADKFDYT